MSDVAVADEVVGRVLEILRRAGLELADVPELAAIPATGRVPDVIDGQIIESAWGNAIRDRTMPRYDTVAALNADTISTQALVLTPNTTAAGYTVATRVGGAWQAKILTRASLTHDSVGTATILPATYGFANIQAIEGCVEWASAGPHIGSVRIQPGNASAVARCYTVAGAGTTSLFISGPATWCFSILGIF